MEISPEGMSLQDSHSLVESDLLQQQQSGGSAESKERSEGKAVEILPMRDSS